MNLRKILYTLKNEVAFSNLLSLRKLFPMLWPHTDTFLHIFLLILIFNISSRHTLKVAFFIYIWIYIHICVCIYIKSNDDRKDHHLKNKASSKFSLLKWRSYQKQDEFTELFGTSKDTLLPKTVLNDVW